jgi:hypothetical protein
MVTKNNFSLGIVFPRLKETKISMVYLIAEYSQAFPTFKQL